MTLKPILWGRGSSTNVQKVLWTAYELGLEVDRRVIGGPFGGNDRPEFRALNPNGTVPVWEEGDFVLWESQAVMRHLARQGERLYGSNPRQVALIDQWLDWSASVFWPPVRLLFLDVFKADKVPAQVNGAQQAIDRTNANLLIVSRVLEAGNPPWRDGFCLADISLSIGLHRLRGLGFQIDLPPVVMQWHEQNKARPGFSYATQDEPAMPGHQP